jgi:hypothetical protein
MPDNEVVEQTVPAPSRVKILSDTMKQHIIEKLTSGRWLFTVAAAVTFVWLSVNKTLPPEDVKELLLLIATFYFAQRAVEKTAGK